MNKPDPMLDMAIVEVLLFRGELWTYVIKNAINAPWCLTAGKLTGTTNTAQVRRRLQKMETADLVERAPTNSGTHHCWRLRPLGHDIYKNWLAAHEDGREATARAYLRQLAEAITSPTAGAGGAA